ncbi:MAG: hypothetical protein H7A24_04730 [Leptospiraceae bacterium]|nr:hypothetical protein [Leptospiraceae bacterium]MCP5511162.1 hypothetical protein [Leptospiraceae bacterium]
MKFFFKFDSGFYKPFFTILLMVVGLNFLLSDFKFLSGSNTEINTVFVKPGTLVVKDSDAEYNVMFTRGETDFTNFPVGGGNALIDSNTVFGKNRIIIRGDLPVRILIYPTLGLVQLPNGLKIIPFFKNVYTTKPFKPDSRAITIKINLVFGVVDVVER